MKKIICLAVAMTCILAMAGCNTASALGSTEKSEPITNTLTDKGLELIRGVDKLAECQEYTALYNPSEEITDVIKGIAENDYTEPKAVFVIENLGETVFKSMLSETKLPSDIEEIAKARIAAAFPSQISAMNGTTAIVSISMLSHGDSFIYEGLKASVTYLYTYDNEYGFMVTYTPNDENIVDANVTIVINETLLKCSTKEEVIRFFNNTMNFEEIAVSVAMEEK